MEKENVILFAAHVVVNKYFCTISTLWRSYKTESNNNDTDDSEQDYA